MRETFVNLRKGVQFDKTSCQKDVSDHINLTLQLICSHFPKCIRGEKKILRPAM